MKRANDSAIEGSSMKTNITMECNPRKKERRDNLLLHEDNYENVDDIKKFWACKDTTLELKVDSLANKEDNYDSDKNEIICFTTESKHSAKSSHDNEKHTFNQCNNDSTKGNLKDDEKYNPPTKIAESYDTDDEGTICFSCGKIPCELTTYGKKLHEEYEKMNLSTVHVKKPNNLNRKHLYQYFIMLVYGKVGKNVRIPISPCITNKIRSYYPEDDKAKYMNFKEK